MRSLSCNLHSDSRSVDHMRESERTSTQRWNAREKFRGDSFLEKTFSNHDGFTGAEGTLDRVDSRMASIEYGMHPGMTR